MKKKKAQAVSSVMLPEVEEFLDAKAMLEEFQEKHSAVFEEFQRLAGHYNSLRAKAEHAVREQKVTSGPFRIVGDNSKGNWEELAKIIGDKNFIALGGSIERVTQFKMDNDTFRLLVEMGRIKRDIAERVFVEGFRYSAPKPLILP